MKFNFPGPSKRCERTDNLYQFQKIKEEIEELEYALLHETDERAMSELMDVLNATEWTIRTFQKSMKIDINKYIEQTIQKNAARGYYK